VGTMLIYILATIQVLIYGWKIGPARARLESEKGAILILPKFFDFIIKYITPSFLLIILAVFIKQSFFEYYNKMNPYYWEENASLLGVDLVSSVEKARISLGVFVILIFIFILTYIMVNFSIKKNKGVTKWN
jgi:SNF family Na+-dependent transporter